VTVRYICGRAGQGKSHFVFEDIKKKLQEHSEEKLLLIVPEQFTLQSERDLINKLKLPGIMRLEVLSFNRLAHKILYEAGGVTKTHLNTQGKNMLLKKALDDTLQDLTIYKNASGQEGFTQKFSDLLSELKKHGISPADLEKIITEKESNGVVKEKLQDILTIYQKFNEYLGESYLDSEDRLELSIKKMAEAQLLKEAVVWIDGFTTFTPQTLQIIEKIMLLAEETTITLTIDFREDKRDSDLFTISQITYDQIHQIAVKNGLPEELIDLNEKDCTPLQSKEILHLEKELFSYPYQKYKDEVHNIEVFAANNITSEIENVALQILTLVRKRGYRWQDIAVVCNDFAGYGSLIKRVFAEYEIPFFLHQNRDLVDNSVVQAILSSLEIITKGYRYDDIVCFLKTGFSDLRPDEIEKLEIYVLKYGICGDKWKQKFQFGGSEDLNELNGYREKIIKPLQKLERNVQGKKRFLEITTALYRYLEDINIRKKLEEWLAKFNQQGLYEYVNENIQIWNTVMEIFDQVLVGNVQRSKSLNIKALFVIGVNDGVLPSGRNDEGILLEDEKAFLEEKGLQLCTGRETKVIEESFSIYQVLSKPRDYLWVSYALSDNEGQALRPSVLIHNLKNIFCSLEIKSDLVNSPERKKQLISTPAGTFKYLVENLRLCCDGEPIEKFWWDVYGWYCESEKWDEIRKRVVKGLFHENQVADIDSQTAKQLYKTPLHCSVSRLEQFVNCPFGHFVRYGLRPREREIFEVGAPEMGELFHNCLSAFVKTVKEENLDWQVLTREQCDYFIDKIMDKLVTGVASGALLSSYRYGHLLSRLKRIAKRTAWIIRGHLRRGDFEPLGEEVGFGDDSPFPPLEIELAGGEKVYLQGRIDRVDILREEDAVYVRIIDYKSGDKKLKLSDVYNGLSLQLVIYLTAILKYQDILGCNNLKPAGVFYFKVHDPIIETDKKDLESIEKEILKKFKMNGLVLQDVDVVRRMDKEIQGWSEIIPAALNKEGGFYKNLPVLEEKDFCALVEHAEDLVKEICEEILGGKITMEPINNGGEKGCKYCLYKAICQFDSFFEDNSYRNIEQLRDEEVIARIRRKKEVSGSEMD